MGTLTKTQRIERIRQLAQMTREIEFYPRNYRYEIGLRNQTVVLEDPPTTYAETIAESDDLSDYTTVRGWAKQAKDGEVVHLYFYSPGDYGQLENVITGWIGTVEHDPVLIHVPGAKMLPVAE